MPCLRNVYGDIAALDWSYLLVITGPLGRSVQTGDYWKREFEHVSVSLDCWTRQANFTGWKLPVPRA